MEAEGDASFREAHLYGWRQAEAAYQKAYNLTGSEECGKKLLRTRFLILIRQIDEDIPYSEADTVIRNLCAGNEHQQVLCKIAEEYRSNTLQPEMKNAPIFKGEDPELEAYFKLLLSDDNSQEAASPDRTTLDDPSAASPLFLYLSLWKLTSRDPAEVEKAYPRFAEAFEFIAESLFQKKKYGTARKYFQKSIELIPDYTHAINGMGKIYFFVLEDYEQALNYFESALEQDPTSITALFGKGAALHELGRYQESIVTIDRMLTGDLTRSGRMDNAGYLYYSGEGHYLKANNYFRMQDPEKARESLDQALQFLPDSEKINELSGVLYFRANKLEEARKDFLSVISKGNSNCNAQLHLGLIYQRLKGSITEMPSEEPGRKWNKKYQETQSLRIESNEKKALNYFLGASSCMESTLFQLNNQLDSVPSLDLESGEKVLLAGKLKKKLAEFRMASILDIEMMINATSENTCTDKENYLAPMREILTRIRRITPNAFK